MAADDNDPFGDAEFGTGEANASTEQDDDLDADLPNPDSLPRLDLDGDSGRQGDEEGDSLPNLLPDEVDDDDVGAASGPDFDAPEESAPPQRLTPESVGMGESSVGSDDSLAPDFDDQPDFDGGFSGQFGMDDDPDYDDFDERALMGEDEENEDDEDGDPEKRGFLDSIKSVPKKTVGIIVVAVLVIGALIFGFASCGDSGGQDKATPTSGQASDRRQLDKETKDYPQYKAVPETIGPFGKEIEKEKESAKPPPPPPKKPVPAPVPPKKPTPTAPTPKPR